MTDRIERIDRRVAPDPIDRVIELRDRAREDRPAGQDGRRRRPAAPPRATGAGGVRVGEDGALHVDVDA